MTKKSDVLSRLQSNNYATSLRLVAQSNPLTELSLNLIKTRRWGENFFSLKM